MCLQISMNSLFGFTGASKAMLPCRPIAESVTSIGRKMIEATRDLVEREFPGSVVVYGGMSVW